jgi:hypothetical protein
MLGAETEMHRRHWAAIVAFAGLLQQADLRAIRWSLNAPDMERALALAQWPSSDADRARFHDRYFVDVHGPTVEYFAVDQVEVITEFRRLDLIAEDHVRLNDLFARSGLRDAEEALRPWRGRVSVVAHLRFDPAKYITGVPDVGLALDGLGGLRPIEVPHRTGIYSGGGDQASLTAGLVEAVFDAESVGQKTRSVVIVWKTRELARVPIDFAALE